MKQVNELTIHEQRDLLAKFMGYFKQNEETNTWYEKGDNAIWVAYSYENWTPDQDWDQLMSVIEKIRLWHYDELEHDIVLERFTMGRYVIDIILNVYDTGEYICHHISNIFTPKRPQISNCRSYQEAVYRSAVEFALIIDHYDGH